MAGPHLNLSCSSYPATPPSGTIGFDFIPIAGYLSFGYRPPPCEFRIIINLITYDANRTSTPQCYQSLPEVIIRPGGNLVEMAITKRYFTGAGSFGHHRTFDTPVPFYDNYTAGQVRIALDEKCPEVTTSDPISFNFTGNIRLGKAVRFYRGDTAVMLFPNTMPSIPPGGNRVHPTYRTEFKWGDQCELLPVGAWCDFWPSSRSLLQKGTSGLWKEAF